MTDQGRTTGRPPDDRRRLVGSIAIAGLAITVGVASLAVSIGVTAPGGSKEPDSFEPGWFRLPDPPLSPRQSATAVSVGGLILVVGGDDAPPCPPNADCAAPAHPLADGATWDPVARVWRDIAPAPVPIGYAEVAVVGPRAFFWIPPFGGARAPMFLAYDVDANAWTELPLPPTIPTASVRLVAVGETVVGYPPNHELGDRIDQAFDVAGGTWDDLPRDPLTPSFDRTIVAAAGRLVSIGVELVPNPGQRPPFYRAAALDLAAGTWRRLADAPIVGSEPTWFAVGGLVVNPALGGADGGGSNNWGRTFPFGGMLDVEGAAWIGLPGPPPGKGTFAGPPVAGEHLVVNRQGWVLDVDELAWQPVGEPDDGPTVGAAAAWAEERLIVFGGARFDDNRGALVGGAWEWRPAGP